jgi:hypothetical protein
MANSEPSRSTIKRLFALSGNRCGFPKCQAPMALDETLVGEVCHIKGKQLGAARYDSAQTEAERNAYENLILLCAPHHTVVDDEAYTVDRLRKMKTDHEARATPISEKDADRVATAYSSVITVGQSGGIAANNFTATHFTLNTAQPVDTVSERQLEALENLWGVILALRETFGIVLYVDTILLTNEIADFFKTLYGRSALLLQNSFIDKKYNDWRLDPGTDQLLRSMLPASMVETIKQKPTGGLSAAIDYLESQFLVEAGMQR